MQDRYGVLPEVRQEPLYDLACQGNLRYQDDHASSGVECLLCRPDVYFRLAASRHAVYEEPFRSAGGDCSADLLQSCFLLRRQMLHVLREALLARQGILFFPAHGGAPGRCEAADSVDVPAKVPALHPHGASDHFRSEGHLLIHMVHSTQFTKDRLVGFRRFLSDCHRVPFPQFRAPREGNIDLAPDPDRVVLAFVCV